MASVACTAPPPETGAEPLAERAPDRVPTPGDWLTLFDGQSTEHWKGFQRESFPEDAWTVEDGTLTPLPDGAVVDLVTRRTFSHYELELEWRVAPNGNSGIFVHVTEDHPQVWHTGPEFQVLDDERHPDGQRAETSAGSVYALVAPTDKLLRPAGEWNTVRLVVRGSRLEQTLNGRTVVTVDVNDETFRERVRASAFEVLPDFARHEAGHVALQHASVSPLKAPVWFRNIRIRELPAD